MARYLFDFQMFSNPEEAIQWNECTSIAPIVPATCTAASAADASDKIMAYLMSIGDGPSTVEKEEDVIDITFLNSGLCVRLLGVRETTPEEVYTHLDIVKKEQPEPADTGESNPYPCFQCPLAANECKELCEKYQKYFLTNN